LSTLTGERVGLLVTVAHPERIEAALRRAGLAPDPVIALGDHAMPSRGELERYAKIKVRCWLTTLRCAVKLPAAIGGAPVRWLEHALSVGALLERIDKPGHDTRVNPSSRAG